MSSEYDTTVTCQNCKYSYPGEVINRFLCLLNPPQAVSVSGARDLDYAFETEHWQNPIVYPESYCSHFVLMEWVRFFDRLDLKGQARELSKNLLVHRYKNGEMVLLIHSKIVPLMNETTVKALSAALKAKLGKNLEVIFRDEKYQLPLAMTGVRQ